MRSHGTGPFRLAAWFMELRIEASSEEADTSDAAKVELALNDLLPEASWIEFGQRICCTAGTSAWRAHPGARSVFSSICSDYFRGAATRDR